jgi:hypothetical protein
MLLAIPTGKIWIWVANEVPQKHVACNGMDLFSLVG